MTSSSRNIKTVTIGLLSVPVLVAALGYFVDIYDLLLFSFIRVKSLGSLGLKPSEVSVQGMYVISIQMYGLLIGGILWGTLGDKKGRLSVLFSSIVLYSLANIANGLVQTVDQYALARFVAGIGLAGELGAGITLVSELIPKEKRGIATSMVAGIGLTGAVFAYFISKSFDWRICYFIGGGLGFFLLLLRVSVFESGMYKTMHGTAVQKGNFFMFFTNVQRFKKYLFSILIGLPTWYVIGVLITFSNDFGKELHLSAPVDPARSVLYAYIAIAIGDFLIGLVSHWFRSRKKALYLFYVITVISLILFFRQGGGTDNGMYAICALMGFGTGFWAIFVTMAAEQFGTNLRATAATTVPNIVRGFLPVIIIVFHWLQRSNTYLNAAAITGAIVMTISIIAVLLVPETFHKDLDYLEQ